MIEIDPSDRFLNENFKLINETPEATFYVDGQGDILISSWKFGCTQQYCEKKFQQNALLLAALVQKHKPKYLLLDFRHFGFELSPQDQKWYISQTHQVWLQFQLAKIALIFKSNLTVQMSIESFMQDTEEDGIKPRESRIFEDIVEGYNWLRLG